MSLLDDPCIAFWAERIQAANRAIEAGNVRKRGCYNGIRAMLKGRDPDLQPHQIEAVIEQIKAELDPRRKQPRNIQAGRFPAGTKTLAFERRVSRACATRGVAGTMRRAA